VRPCHRCAAFLNGAIRRWIIVLHRLWLRRVARWALVPLLIGLVALRFVHLGADPLPGLTWSGTLYTDEGFYAANAAAWAQTGEWYIEGGFNPAIYLPVWSILLVIGYRIAGVSLASTRATSAILALGVPLLAYVLLASYHRKRAGLLAALILMAHYRLVGLSRLALADVPMTTLVLASLLAWVHALRRRSVLLAALSGVLFVFALLNKTTAVFVLPVLGAALLIERARIRSMLPLVAPWMSAAALCLAVYYLALPVHYPDDYHWLQTELVRRKLGAVFLPLPSAPRQIARMGYYATKSLGGVWTIATAVAVAFVGLDDLRLEGLRNMRMWQSPVPVLGLVWIASMFGLLSVSHYYPPRYLMPMMVSLAMLSAWIIFDAPHSLGGRTLRPAYTVILAAAMLWWAGHLILYLTQPDDSFLRLAQMVKQEAASSTRPPMLLGQIGCSLRLETGIPAISEHLGLYDLEAKLAYYDPTHYVCIDEPEARYRAVIEKRYRLDLVGSYDLYRNYKGAPAHLYRLAPLSGP
jgi:4-amino-4-deoxy-L-arabinose transferase-like glycosyltransferase